MIDFDLTANTANIDNLIYTQNGNGFCRAVGGALV